MKLLNTIWQFLTVKKEVTPVTDQVVETTPATTAVETTPATTAVETTPATVVTPVAAVDTGEKAVLSDVDAVLAKLKTLLIAAGHDVEEEFDDAVAYAKTLAAKL